MRASANGMGRSPKNSLAADPNEAAAGAGGRPAPRGVKSPLDSSDVESAMKARQVAVTDGKSPLAERLAVLPTLGLEDLRREWRRLSRAEPARLSRDIMMRAIAYRMQEIAQGGLSKVTQRRLMTLANQLETDGRIVPLPGPRIKSGSRLIRAATLSPATRLSAAICSPTVAEMPGMVRFRRAPAFAVSRVAA